MMTVGNMKMVHLHCEKPNDEKLMNFDNSEGTLSRSSPVCFYIKRYSQS